MEITSIIVPLYNGYDFFKDCFESILKNTEKGTYRLIIINDSSQEDSLLQYLKKIKDKNDENVIIINNDDNLGFIGSVNRGMKYDNNDVVLLNSDTIVTKNWLSKMRNCAYSDKKIGTVTPLANNAAIVSFPTQWDDNEIPKGFTLESISNLIEKVSQKIYPEIPSPVGFCMYIKREVIKKVGFLDQIYGKGYGEENDFGMRAYRIGYRHVLDDATFILHKGSMTFKHFEKKKELVEKNTKILHGRFPELNKLLLKFEKENPFFPIYNNIKFNMETESMKKPGILYVSVNEVDKYPSGALLHIKNLINNSENDSNKYVIYRKDNKIILVLYKNDGEKIRFIFNFKNKFSITEFSHSEIESVWELILTKFNIDLVHFQTPQDLPLSLFELTKSLKKPIFFTAHDFLLYCPSFILTKYEPKLNTYKFCNYEKDEHTCKECLNYRIGTNIQQQDFQETRRNYIKKHVLPFIDLFFFPSLFLKNKTQDLFPDIISEEKTLVIEHGSQTEEVGVIHNQDVKKINIAHIGTFSEIKGSKIFKDVVKKFANNSNVNFFIIGKIEDNDSLLSIKKYTNVKITGSYKKNDLGKIILKNKINISLVLSICPETFSFTISESWLHYLPVIALRLGAQEERISKTGAGWIVGVDNPVDEISKIIEDIQKDNLLILEKIKMIPKLKTEKENAAEFDHYYEKFVTKMSTNEELDSKMIYRYIQKNKKEINDTPIKFSLDRSNVKHLAFVFFSKLGLVNIIRPLYYKNKEKIEKIVEFIKK